MAAATLSGVLANWLVGMAAFLSFMGRAIVAKYIPVLLPASVCVASGFLHSPAKMAYVSLTEPAGLGPAMAWAVLSVALGNIVAGVFLALQYWYLQTAPYE